MRRKVYQLQLDGDYVLYQAETMQGAINLALDAHLKEFEDDDGPLAGEERQDAVATFHADVLESCHLLGELEN